MLRAARRQDVPQHERVSPKRELRELLVGTARARLAREQSTAPGQDPAAVPKLSPAQTAKQVDDAGDEHGADNARNFYLNKINAIDDGQEEAQPDSSDEPALNRRDREKD